MGRGNKSLLPKAEGRVMGEINVTPMVDIMLVLLIVFIITAPVMHQAFRLNLPQENADAIRQEPAETNLFISAAGEVSIDDRVTPEEALAGEFARIREKDPETVIHLRADEKTPYGRIARALALTREAGLTRILFVTRPGKKD